MEKNDIVIAISKREVSLDRTNSRFVWIPLFPSSSFSKQKKGGARLSSILFLSSSLLLLLLLLFHRCSNFSKFSYPRTSQPFAWLLTNSLGERRVKNRYRIDNPTQWTCFFFFFYFFFLSSKLRQMWIVTRVFAPRWMWNQLLHI